MFDDEWQAEIKQAEARDRVSRKLLGVPESACEAEILAAFRRASMNHHPDRNRGDADAARRFHLAVCAYRFLIKGEPSTALDELLAPDISGEDEKRRMQHSWGYWCWWMETYFEGME